MLNRSAVVRVGFLVQTLSSCNPKCTGGGEDEYRAIVISFDESLFKAGVIDRRGEFAEACGLNDTV